jgi:hypothetical protein
MNMAWRPTPKEKNMASKDPGIGTFIGLGCAGIFVLFVLYLFASFMGVVGTVVTAPGRVINKTLQTDNIIYNYEWFHDTAQAFGARVNQIASHKRAMAQVPPAETAELSRYRVEVEGMRQSCRDMAAHYNANALKVNRAVFRDPRTPPQLFIEACDA